jgi:hypothetical protein
MSSETSEAGKKKGTEVCDPAAICTGLKAFNESSNRWVTCTTMEKVEQAQN